jgi:hypothetical protein
MHPSRPHRRGSTAIEFALSVPVLFLLLGAVVDYGLYMFRFNQLNHALHEATRYGITGNPDADADAATRPEVLTRARLAEIVAGMGILCDDDDLLEDNCEVRATLGDGGAADYTWLRAEIDLDYNPLVLDIFDGLGDDILLPDQLRVSYTMRLQLEAEGNFAFECTI